ncbi:hypothetical protein KGO5_01712 [Sinorhizobium sp. KGO-5]|uniref:hypothetical protein n=1 Tax=Sinorhizobium sp. KGO-5 TaxID=1470810 RepID=UPI00294919FC|nr:hypothetical protein KGO5_01712 [Sinorhizobium sp. KGO-5]
MSTLMQREKNTPALLCLGNFADETEVVVLHDPEHGDVTGIDMTVADLRALLTSRSAVDERGRGREWQQFLGELETWCCELPDRTSPADAPEMMLFDREELHMMAEKVRDFVTTALVDRLVQMAEERGFLAAEDIQEVR